MVHILNIHTTTETAVINLMAGPQILGTFINQETKQHASFLHTAINELLQQHGVDMKNLSAIGVTAGPGSYTGIRVGLATAMGLCYALQIPMVTFNALEVMAITASKFAKDSHALYCPMIDARRMEVYMAVYDYDMKEILAPSAMILHEDSFIEIPGGLKMFFSGSGSNKFQAISKRTNTGFLNCGISSESLAYISWKKYIEHDVENVPYAQPLYMK